MWAARGPGWGSRHRRTQSASHRTRSRPRPSPAGPDISSVGTPDRVTCAGPDISSVGTPDTQRVTRAGPDISSVGTPDTQSHALVLTYRLWGHRTHRVTRAGPDIYSVETPDTRSVPELANLGGKQHLMDFIFPLFPSKFTMDFPLSSTENIIICNN